MKSVKIITVSVDVSIEVNGEDFPEELTDDQSSVVDFIGKVLSPDSLADLEEQEKYGATSTSGDVNISEPYYVEEIDYVDKE